MADVSASNTPVTPDAVNQLIDTVNKVASKDDRWLFVALLVIGLVFIWILFKYFTQEIKRLRDRMDVDRDLYHKQIDTIHEKYHSQAVEQTRVIANNTVALQECQTVVRELLQSQKPFKGRADV